MKIVVVSNEIPFPVTHGGRFDQWGRWQRMKARGHELVLITWTTEPVSDSARTTLGTVFNSCYIFLTKSGVVNAIKRVLLLPIWPSHVSSRNIVVSREITRNILSELRGWGCDLVFSDGIYGGDFAKNIAKSLSIPLVVRSHNIEHEYFKQQIKSSKNLKKKIVLTFSFIGLRRFEISLLRGAAVVMDISLSDASYWRGLNVNAIWVPTLVSVETENFMLENLKKCDSINSSASYDFAYVGNLTTPNNVEAVKRIISLVDAAKSDGFEFSVVVAGSNPSRSLITDLESSGITVFSNPPEVYSILSNAKAIINPVVAGSGVNMKTIEALGTGLPVFSSPIGAQGLSASTARFLNICYSDSDFLDAMKSVANKNFGRSRDQILATIKDYGCDSEDMLNESMISLVNV